MHRHGDDYDDGGSAPMNHSNDFDAPMHQSNNDDDGNDAPMHHGDD